MESEEIRERLKILEEKITVLEWDDKRMQINPYKKVMLEEMKKERQELNASLEKDSEESI